MRPGWRTLAACLLAMSIPFDIAQAGEAMDLDIAMAISRTRARAVARVAESTVLVRAFRGAESGEGRIRYGTGMVVQAEGGVLTCLHVVEGADAVVVLLADGTAAAGRVTARDEGADVALLRVDWGSRRPPPVVFADDSTLAVGESVLALGNPLGVGLSASLGIVAAKGRRGVVAGQPSGLLQTDTSTHPGCSGGPLFDLRGEVLGMVNAVLEPDAGSRSVAFAVPASELQRVLADFLAGKEVRRAWLGIQVRPVRGAEPGLEIEAVVPGSPGEAAGVRSGDLLLALGSAGIVDLESLRAALRALRPGERTFLRILRGGRPEQLDVQVGERPSASTPPPQ
ncbi:MAG: S1C family serine protease [Planctomycetaceae bacterium]